MVKTIKSKKLISIALTLVMLAVMLPMFSVVVSAEMGTLYGDTGLYYQKCGTYCEITDCDTSVTSVTIPETIDNLPVTSIGDNAFFDCTNLESITLNNSITSIGQKAFLNTGYYNNASNWDNGVLYIGKYLINANDQVSETYTIKDGTELIAQRAFYQCTTIKKVVIPESVKTILWCAFDGCSNLADIQILNDNLRIEDWAFSDTVYYNNSNNWENGILYIGKHLIVAKTNISGEVKIKDGTTTIAKNAFERKTNITEINFPNSLLRITEYAFYGCTNLQNITIPSSVTVIERYAFNRCTKLESITIPESVTDIGNYAFGNCTGLKSATINCENMGKYMFNGCTDLTNVTFGEKVKSIGYSTFYGCGMESIVIPSHIEKIDVNAFRKCSKLKNISILNDNIDIGESAFWSCSSLTNIDFLPKTVTAIGKGWFCDCTGLVNVTVPNHITSIGANAFKECTNLTNLTLHDGITNIGTDAFYGCGFSSITLPKGITTISDRMFMDCKNLTSLDIPNGVTSIGFAAFSGCDKLKSINIPKSVTSIGWRAFLNCENLNNVNYAGTEEEWKKIAIDNKYNGNEDLNNATINYNCVPKTTTTVSEKTFTVTGNYIDENIVVLALYDGNRLVDCKTAKYEGTPITHTTTATGYTSAKVMVWESWENLSPVTTPEDVTLQ